MSNLPTKTDIIRSFNQAVTTYDQYAFIQKEIGHRLLERLHIVKSPPKVILDIGAGTGYITRQLQRQFRHSKIIGVDLAKSMIFYAKNKQSWHWWKNQPTYVCAEAAVLPFANESVDLIFSNFTLQWCFDLTKVFNEFKRVLAPNGMVFFTTLGPQTLFELRESFAKADGFTHVNSFIDMHDIGDILLHSQLVNPVTDMEMVKIDYKNVMQLLKDLKGTGAHNIHPARSRGLTAKNSLSKMLDAYEKFKTDGFYPATFEVIYGHALKQQKQVYSQDKDGLVRIPGGKIPLLNF